MLLSNGKYSFFLFHTIPYSNWKSPHNIMKNFYNFFSRAGIATETFVFRKSEEHLFFVIVVESFKPRCNNFSDGICDLFLLFWGSVLRSSHIQEEGLNSVGTVFY